jgi:hypothetical protein
MWAITGGQRSQRRTSCSVDGTPTSCERVIELSSVQARKTGTVTVYQGLPSVSLHKYRDWTSSQTTHSSFTMLRNSLAIYHHTTIICRVEYFDDWRNKKQNKFSFLLCVGFFSLRKIFGSITQGLQALLIMHRECNRLSPCSSDDR